jgi:hypothetical protein
MNVIHSYNNQLHCYRVDKARDKYGKKYPEHVMNIRIPDQPGMDAHAIKYDERCEAV